MSPVQFEPKITPDFQLDWRRPSSQAAADPFADLLKRHVEVDQRARAPKKREDAGDPLSGRPPRVVVAHERTLRGEAKRIEDTDRCLPRSERCATEEPLEDSATATTEAETPAKAGTEATAEQPAQITEGEVEVVDPAAPVIVSVQPAADTATEGDIALTAVPLPVPTENGIEADAADQATTGTPSNGAETDPEATAEQQAVPAMVEAGLTDGVVALTTGQPAPVAGAAASATTIAQIPAIPATPAQPEHPLLQTKQAVPAIEPAAIAPAKPERASMDIKLRASAPARATPATPASPAAATASAAPQTTTLLQPSTVSEFASTGEPFDPALSEGGTGQGWALHLAQGAAGRRPDFVAQLRQHLQNLPAHEQVAVHLQRAVREGTNKFSIQLSPAELGNIHVKLEIDEEKRVTAAVTVERPSTLELLQRDTKGLERALHNAGLNMEGGDLSFSLGQGDQEFGQDLRQSAASATGGPVLDTESDGDQPASPVAQVTDTAAGVVNLQV
jgi:flagellar hook-length control protein FliK